MDILGALNFVLSVVIGLFILSILIAAHELGHGIAARRNGVVVEEFGLGFPPRAKAWKVKKSILGKNVLFTLNWLPLGGFVKLQGEHDSDSKKGDYGAASFWAKTKILLMGIVMNWVIAVVLLSGVAMTVGLPKLLPGQFMIKSDTTIQRQPVAVTYIEADSPAGVAGLKIGDVLVAFGDTQVYDAAQMVSLAKDNRGKTVSVEYTREGKTTQTEVVIRAENTDGKGYLGLTSSQKQSTTYRSGWSGPIVGVVVSGQLTGYTFDQLGQMVVKLGSGITEKLSVNTEVREQGDEKLGEVSNSVGGPVAILGVLFPSARNAGVAALVMTTALISLTLAIMNLLPIPGLDGGRWFVTLLYRKILRQPLDQETEEKIHGTGMMILFALIIIVTIADVWKFV